MRASVVLLLLLAVPLLAAPAQACSWVRPSAFEALAWDGPEALLTQHGYRAGRYHLATGTLEARADTFPTSGFAAGPRRQLAYGRGGDDPAQHTEGPMCEVPFGATEVLDLETGEVVRLLDGGARAVAASNGTLAVAHRLQPGVLAYRWGAWEEPTLLRAAGLDMAYAWRLAVSPHGSLVGVVDSGDGTGPADVFVFDAASGALRGTLRLGSGEPVMTMAFSPDQRHLALGTSLNDRAGHLRIHDLAAPGLPQVAERRDAEGLFRLAWGTQGLAASYTAYHADRDPVEPRGVLRLFRGPALEQPREAAFPNESLAGGLAWSPDGARLAAGGGGELRILDDDLRVLRTAGEPRTVERLAPPSEGPPATPRITSVSGPGLALLALAAAGVALAARRRS